MMNDRSVKLSDGRQLSFAEYGDPKGIPIFYFHGFPGSRLEAGRFHEIAVVNRYRLIWQGTVDTQTPVSHAKICANLMPNSQLKIIENEGHHSLLENYIEKILRELYTKN